MEPFEFLRAQDPADALAKTRGVSARFIAGGTGLLDLMKLGVEQPAPQQHRRAARVKVRNKRKQSITTTWDTGVPSPNATMRCRRTVTGTPTTSAPNLRP